MAEDIFEKLRELAGCEFISDLRTGGNRTKARRLVKKLKLERYELRSLSDLAEYLYGKKPEFETCEQAKAFFLAGQP